MSGVDTWTVTIPGTPRPQGKLTGRTAAGQHYPATTIEHRVRCEYAMRQEWRPRPTIGKPTPVEVTIVASFPRPASHYGTGRNAGSLKAWAPSTCHAQIPDSDKVSRLICDALTNAGVIEDDAQVAVLHVEKRWAPRDTEPFTRVTLRTVDALTRGELA